MPAPNAHLELPRRGPWPTDRAALQRDCAVEFLRGSGPGGQHRNKTESGVRLLHGPSGEVVRATERRSQAMNLEVAYERMAARLDALQRPVRRRLPTRVGAGALARREQARRAHAARKAQRRTPLED